MEKSRVIFPCFMLQYDYRWKFFHPIRAICGKFSIYQHCYIKPAAGSFISPNGSKTKSASSGK
jgi:hypothetical protein